MLNVKYHCLHDIGETNDMSSVGFVNLKGYPLKLTCPFQVLPSVISESKPSVLPILIRRYESSSLVYKCWQNGLESISSEIEVKFYEVRKNNK